MKPRQHVVLCDVPFIALNPCASRLFPVGSAVAGVSPSELCEGGWCSGGQACPGCCGASRPHHRSCAQELQRAGELVHLALKVSQEVQNEK